MADLWIYKLAKFQGPSLNPKIREIEIIKIA